MGPIPHILPAGEGDAVSPLPPLAPPPRHHGDPKPTMPRHPNPAWGADFQPGHPVVLTELHPTPALPASVSPFLRWSLAAEQAPNPAAPPARETPEEPIPMALGLEVVRRERNSRRAAASPSSFCVCVCIYINTQQKKKIPNSD